MSYGTMTCYDATQFDTTPGLEQVGISHLGQCGGGKRRLKRRSRKSKRGSIKRRSRKCKCPPNCKACKKHNCKGGGDCPCDIPPKRRSTRRSTRRSRKIRRSRRRSTRRSSRSRKIRRSRRHFTKNRK